MSLFFAMTRDINGFNGFGLPMPTYCYSANLATSTASTITVPSSEAKWIAIFAVQPGGDCYIAVNNIAAVPVGSTFASTTSVYNNIGIQVNAGDVISCITPDASCYVTVSLYALNGNS